MCNRRETGELADDFPSTVRLFPLPNLVMFPLAVQSLHIFEPRYREMLEDALEHDGLLAMALLQPGWEPDYYNRPAVFPVTCVGRIASHSRLDDGCYNIMLSGLHRATIVRELPADRAFRCAEVSQLEDLYPTSGAGRRLALRRELLRGFERLLPEAVLRQQQIQQLFADQIPLGVLTDIVAFTLPFEVSSKQQLLTEWNVDLRVASLLKLIRNLSLAEESNRPSAAFPPGFSEN